VRKSFSSLCPVVQFDERAIQERNCLNRTVTFDRN
jgi:hypothetical protein